MFVIRSPVGYVMWDGNSRRIYTPLLKDAEKYPTLRMAKSEKIPTEAIKSLKMEIDRYRLVGNKMFR